MDSAGHISEAADLPVPATPNRFVPGQSGNPKGRPRGSRNKTSAVVEGLMAGEAEALARTCIEKALEGDPIALRLCLERIAPKRRDPPVAFRMPPIETAEDAEKGGAALIAAVAAGELSAVEAGPIMGLLVAQKGLIESGEHERRLTRLEEAAARQRR
jgi:hypothetical protein